MPGGSPTWDNFHIVNCDGFDTYTTTAELQLLRGSGAQLALGQGPYGTAAIRIDFAGSAFTLGGNDNTGAIVPTGMLAACAHTKVDALPSASVLWVTLDVGSLGACGAQLNPNGSITFHVGVTGAQGTTAPGIVIPGNWNVIGIRFDNSFNMSLWLNNNPLFSIALGASSNTSGLTLHATGQSSGQFTWFDDPVICRSTDTVSKGLDHAYLVSAFPVGNGSSDNLIPGSGAFPNYTYVDDIFPDADVSYLTTNGTTGAASYSINAAAWANALSVEDLFITVWAKNTSGVLPISPGSGGGTFSSNFQLGATGYYKYSVSPSASSFFDASAATEIGFNSVNDPGGRVTAVQVYVARSIASGGASLVVPSLFLPIAAGSPTVLAAGQLQASGLAVPVALGSPVLTVDQAIFVPSQEVPVYMSPNLVVQPERIAPLGLFLPVPLGPPVVYDANAAAAGGNSLVIRR